jgi:hypothetical protein
VADGRGRGRNARYAHHPGATVDNAASHGSVTGLGGGWIDLDPEKLLAEAIRSPERARQFIEFVGYTAILL